jgi:hypothetical protein
MYKIASQLSLCGEPIADVQIIEKKLYPRFMLPTLYWLNNIKTCDTQISRFHISVISCREARNELLLNNHGELPIGTFFMHNHATYVSTTRFTSQGSRRRPKLDEMRRRTTQRKTQ